MEHAIWILMIRMVAIHVDSNNKPRSFKSLSSNCPTNNTLEQFLCSKLPLSTSPKHFHLIVILFSISDEMEKIKIPKDMEDAKALGTVLSKYKDTYYAEVLMAYFTTYILYPLKKCMQQNYLWFCVSKSIFTVHCLNLCLVLLAIMFGLCCGKSYAICPHTDLWAIFVRQDICGNQCIVIVVVAITRTLPWHSNRPTFSDLVATLFIFIKMF